MPLAALPRSAPLAVTLGGDPYLAPAVLLLCGLLAMLFASFAARRHTGWRRLLAVGGHGLVVTLALVAAGGMMVERARVFWGAHWGDGGRTLVLERLGWLPDVRLARDEIAAVTEFRANERTMTGSRGAVRYVVRTADRAYWSAPIYRGEEVGRTRELLIAATGRRLERFQVGDPRLAD